MQSSQVRNVGLPSSAETKRDVPAWTQDPKIFSLDWFSVSRPNIIRQTKEYVSELSKWRNCPKIKTVSKLKAVLKRFMMFLHTHTSYIDGKSLLECDLEEDLITLVSLYIDMELRVLLVKKSTASDSTSGQGLCKNPGPGPDTEMDTARNDKLVADRISYWLYTVLTGHEQRLDALLSITVFTRHTRPVLDPIFRKILSEMSDGPFSSVNYVRHMLAYKTWRERALLPDDTSSEELNTRVLQQLAAGKGASARDHARPHNVNLSDACRNFIRFCRGMPAAVADQINFESIPLFDDDMLSDEENEVNKLMNMISDRKQRKSASLSLRSSSFQVDAFIDLTLPKTNEIHNQRPLQKDERCVLVSIPEKLPTSNKSAINLSIINSNQEEVSLNIQKLAGGVSAKGILLENKIQALAERVRNGTRVNGDNLNELYESLENICELEISTITKTSPKPDGLDQHNPPNEIPQINSKISEPNITIDIPNTALLHLTPDDDDFMMRNEPFSLQPQPTILQPLPPDPSPKSTITVNEQGCLDSAGIKNLYKVLVSLTNNKKEINSGILLENKIQALAERVRNGTRVNGDNLNELYESLENICELEISTITKTSPKPDGLDQHNPPNEIPQINSKISEPNITIDIPNTALLHLTPDDDDFMMRNEPFSLQPQPTILQPLPPDPSPKSTITVNEQGCLDSAGIKNLYKVLVSLTNNKKEINSENEHVDCDTVKIEEKETKTKTKKGRSKLKSSNNQSHETSYLLNKYKNKHDCNKQIEINISNNKNTSTNPQRYIRSTQPMRVVTTKKRSVNVLDTNCPPDEPAKKVSASEKMFDKLLEEHKKEISEAKLKDETIEDIFVNASTENKRDETKEEIVCLVKDANMPILENSIAETNKLSTNTTPAEGLNIPVTVLEYKMSKSDINDKLISPSDSIKLVESNVTVERQNDISVNQLDSARKEDKEGTLSEDPLVNTKIHEQLEITKGSVKEYPDYLFGITESPVPSGSFNSPYPSDISLTEEPTFYEEGGMVLFNDYPCYDSFEVLQEQQSLQREYNVTNNKKEINSENEHVDCDTVKIEEKETKTKTKKGRSKLKSSNNQSHETSYLLNKYKNKHDCNKQIEINISNNKNTSTNPQRYIRSTQPMRVVTTKKRSVNVLDTNCPPDEPAKKVSASEKMFDKLLEEHKKEISEAKLKDETIEDIFVNASTENKRDETKVEIVCLVKDANMPILENSIAETNKLSTNTTPAEGLNIPVTVLEYKMSKSDINDKLISPSDSIKLVESNVTVERQNDISVNQLDSARKEDKEGTLSEDPLVNTKIHEQLEITKGSVKEYPDYLFGITESPVPSGSFNSPYPSDISLTEEPTFYEEGGMVLFNDYPCYDSFEVLQEQQSLQREYNVTNNKKEINSENEHVDCDTVKIEEKETKTKTKKGRSKLKSSNNQSHETSYLLNKYKNKHDCNKQIEINISNNKNTSTNPQRYIRSTQPMRVVTTKKRSVNVLDTNCPPDEPAKKVSASEKMFDKLLEEHKKEISEAKLKDETIEDIFVNASTENKRDETKVEIVCLVKDANMPILENSIAETNKLSTNTTPAEGLNIPVTVLEYKMSKSDINDKLISPSDSIKLVESNVTVEGQNDISVNQLDSARKEDKEGTLSEDPLVNTKIHEQLEITKGSVKEYPDYLFGITESPVPSGSFNSPYPSDISLTEEPTFYEEGGMVLFNDYPCYDSFEVLQEQQSLQREYNVVDDNPKDVQQGLQAGYCVVDSQFLPLPEYMNDGEYILIDNNIFNDKRMVPVNMHEVQPEAKPHNTEELKRSEFDDSEKEDNLSETVDEIIKNIQFCNTRDISVIHVTDPVPMDAVDSISETAINQDVLNDEKPPEQKSENKKLTNTFNNVKTTTDNPDEKKKKEKSNKLYHHIHHILRLLKIIQK